MSAVAGTREAAEKIATERIARGKVQARTGLDSAWAIRRPRSDNRPRSKPPLRARKPSRRCARCCSATMAGTSAATAGSRPGRFARVLRRLASTPAAAE
jgi:hypothetical protein